MKDRRFKPMMMTASMRAYIRRLKTMTRRLLNPQPDHFHRGILDGRKNWDVLLPQDGDREIRCPYSPGDLLWIKEPWIGEVPRFNFRADYAPDGASILRWRSPMFMPKAACRHIAEVTEVRSPERVQEISTEDAIAEGCTNEGGGEYAVDGMSVAQVRFMDLWDSIHKDPKKPERRWDANPWVWPIVFRPFDCDELAEALRELKGK